MSNKKTKSFGHNIKLIKNSYNMWFGRKMSSNFWKQVFHLSGFFGWVEAFQKKSELFLKKILVNVWKEHHFYQNNRFDNSEEQDVVKSLIQTQCQYQYQYYSRNGSVVLCCAQISTQPVFRSEDAMHFIL